MNRKVVLIALLTLLAVFTAACGPGGTTSRVNSVTINGEDNLTLMVGETEPLSATVNVTGTAARTVTWTSSNTAVATVVGTTGLVTAVTEGTATITATSTVDATKKDTLTVTVEADSGEPTVTSVTITPGDDFTLGLDETRQLEVEVITTGGAPDTVTWESSDDTKVTVSDTGLVTAIAETESEAPVTITATSTEDDTKFDSVLVTVTTDPPPPPPTIVSVTIGQEDPSLVVGGSVTLTADVVVDPEGSLPTTVIWESDDPAIVEIDPNTGVATARAIGEALITAISTEDDTKSDSVLVTVTEATGPTVTVTILGSGTGQIFVNGEEVTSGETVSVTGTEAIIQVTGTVIAWGGDCGIVKSGTTCRLTMDGNAKNVTVAFDSENDIPASLRVTNAGLPPDTSDDVEEFVSAFSTFDAGEVYMDSSRIDLTYDTRGTLQVVGLRFRNIDIPQGAVILNAYIQFRSAAVLSDAPDQEPLVLTIEAQDSAKASFFTDILFSVSSRPRLDTSVQWAPAAWTTTGAGLAQQTPNLTDIVQRLVSKAEWVQADNAPVFIITSNDTLNRRAAQSVEATMDGSGAPQLVVVYEVPAAPAP